MKCPSLVLAILAVPILIAGDYCPVGAQTGSASSGTAPVSSPQTETVKQYLEQCRTKTAKDAGCEKLRKDAVEILKEDLRTLGSSAERGYLLTIVPILQNEEVELRIAAADAIGMIGPQDRDVDFLGSAANDPVPNVRAAVGEAIGRGKGPALSLLTQRTLSMQRTGVTPEVPADAGKFALPVAPDSTYLFYASDPGNGRLSYVGKGTSASAFYKAKAKKGPFKFEEFKEAYHYQLEDEAHALGQAHDAAAKQFENEKKPDPTNTQAMMDYIQKMQSVNSGRMSTMTRDLLQPNLFGAPTVYVLEERQIGQRSYPTRYVVLYEELALKRPGYRLSWMTVSDDAIKVAQVASLKDEQQEQIRKKENEAARKRSEELDALTKKKDEAEKKKFKKGQDDLEKELGF